MSGSVAPGVKSNGRQPVSGVVQPASIIDCSHAHCSVGFRRPARSTLCGAMPASVSVTVSSYSRMVAPRLRSYNTATSPALAAHENRHRPIQHHPAGDFEGNVARMIDYAARAKSAGATLMITPELALTGYPPEDLLFRRDFLRTSSASLENSPYPSGISSSAIPQEQGGALYNAASLVEGGRIAGTYFKQRLPNYQVFDEKRYFHR